MSDLFKSLEEILGAEKMAELCKQYLEKRVDVSGEQIYAIYPPIWRCSPEPSKVRPIHAPMKSVCDWRYEVISPRRLSFNDDTVSETKN